MAKETQTTELPAEPTMAQVLAFMAKIQADAQVVQREQLKQTKEKSNKASPKISVFNPQGEKDYPMPRLKCDVFVPWRNTPEMHGFDWEEVELFNLLEPGEYPVELNDGAVITVNVVGVRNSLNGKIEKMSLFGMRDEEGRYSGLFTNENKQQFPSLKMMLRQMIGESASSVLSMQKRRALVADGKLPISVGE